MRKIVGIVSFMMMLGQVGNMELGQAVIGGQVIKLLVLLGIFYLSIKKYMK